MNLIEVKKKRKNKLADVVEYQNSMIEVSSNNKNSLSETKPAKEARLNG